MRHMVLTNENS